MASLSAKWLHNCKFLIPQVYLTDIQMWFRLSFWTVGIPAVGLLC